MKNKGFTLIELLAVIVILAIIALIATPIILGIIKDAREQGNQRSVDNYAKAVQNAVVRNQLSENNNISGCFTTEDGTNLTLLDKTESSLMIEYEGSGIKCNIIEIYKDGNVYLDECIVNGSSKKYTYGKKQGYNDGDIIYFDVYNGVACTEDDYHVDNSKTGYNGIYEGDASRKTTDNQNGCLKFYAFNDYCGDKINLLLDHNTTATVEWITKEAFDSAGGIVTEHQLLYDNECRFNGVCIGSNVGPLILLKQLYNDTKDWKGTLILSDNTIDQRDRTSQAYYTVEYSKKPEYEGATAPYKARLISFEEIIKITKSTTFEDVGGKNLYFHDSSTNYNTGNGSVCADSGCKYDWLYDRTYTSCTTYGCANNSDIETVGYWTISSISSSSYFAWVIGNKGDMCNGYVADSEHQGIRPVIEVSKSKLQIN